MSRKAYSQQERTALKKRLHEIGLDIYLKQGIQNVKLPEILQLAGISKPFSYTTLFRSSFTPFTHLWAI